MLHTKRLAMSLPYFWHFCQIYLLSKIEGLLLQFLSELELVNVAFEVLTVVPLNIQVFWEVGPRRLLNISLRFGIL
jgi:hypothetical protein